MDDHRPGIDLSPLFMALLGILAGMVVVATYQCIASNCFQRGQAPLQDPERGLQSTARLHTRSGLAGEISMPANGITSEQSASGSSIFKYKNKFGEGTCAVCLCEFSEDEDIRVLPECAHTFHAGCIDMWLFSHSNCPLCRAETSISGNALSAPHSSGAELHGVAD
ncbi:hypothetical protein CDL15_Pgr020594 [Punica granatum]|uniref:RING-type E3 ubiquitin transferase n=1 Tax=Punica granatum TaxID=22663 RepID=A0A218VVP5_PUNGR|nr:hypothetical protein CDL15_Pgr020594 [Punica granatum]PKI39383.1 hypothetical protein CRG98_040249 [Punica granatum]